MSQESRVAWLQRGHSLDAAVRALLDWAGSRAGAGPAHARVAIPELDPLVWVASQTHQSGRWFYQCRAGTGGGICFAGLGRACVASRGDDGSIQRLTSLSDRSAWCTGPIAFSWLPFPGEEGIRSQEMWGELSTPHVLVPCVDVRRDADGWSIGATVSEDPASTIAALRSVQPLRDLDPAPLLTVTSDGNPARWADAVEAALGAIETGELEKVVLARTRELRPANAQGVPVDPFAIARTLRDEEPNSAVAVLAPGGDQSFVMASPERLYRRRDRIIESHAVAGTCGRGPHPDADQRLAGRLLRSEKNRREHELTLRHIERALETLTTEQSWQSEPRILRLSHVQHLVTEVRGALRPGVTDQTIIAALHPTPAVGGVPAATAQSFIHEQEEAPRGLYSGVVGVSCDAAAEFSVAIRSACVLRDRVIAYAGAGIVEGSEADAEWLETARKFETLDALARPRRVSL